SKSGRQLRCGEAPSICAMPFPTWQSPNRFGGPMRLRNAGCSRLAVAALTLLAASTTLLAQVTTARLEGFVRDPSDAVVPGVAVVSVHESTKISYEALTNESGLFVFAKLPPGRHTLSAEIPGFKRYQATGIILEVGDTRSYNV